MRTLKARDAFRAKTANAAEKKKSACDHRDLAAVKEMRQKMFEQQRQYVWLTCVYGKMYRQ